MRVHLVDGTYELFRAHFSQRPGHLSREGKDAKATVGIAGSMLALLADTNEAVTHVAVAFDNPIRSFRNDLFPPYKSDEGVPPELRSQFDDAEEALRALGIAVWSMKQYEADDALATGAALFRDQVEQVRIMTPDKDLGQCLRDKRVVQVDRRRELEIDTVALLERRGVLPESIPDFLALVGDDADGLPGVPGFGEKTASALLAKYVHLESIPESTAHWPPGIRGTPRLAAALAEHREQAYLYRKLATLVEDVPLGVALEDLRWKGVPKDLFDPWCERMKAESLRERPFPTPRA